MLNELTNNINWGTDYNQNVVTVNTKIGELFESSSQNAGTPVVLNVTINVTPTNNTITPLSLTNISGSGNDADINANFTAIQTAVNAIISELSNKHSYNQAVQTALNTTIPNKINELLAAIRKNTGVAILNEQVS